MSPIDALFTGLKNLWDATPALDAIATHKDRRPGTETDAKTNATYYPYIVMAQLGKSTKSGESVIAEYWDHVLEFRIYHRNDESAAPVATLIRDTLNPRTLPAAMTMPTKHRLTRATHTGDQSESITGETTIVKRTLTVEFTTAAEF